VAGLAIRKGGDPVVRRNRIHDNKGTGVSCNDGGNGTLEDNEVFVNGEFGITITGAANPTLRRNRIYACKQFGVAVTNGGKGALEDNSIFANRWGIVVLSDGSPVVRRNRINQNGNQGVYVDGSGGIFEENDLRDNIRGPWRIKPGCTDKTSRNGNIEK
jgi:parallel beta-helix repeat protein